MFTKKKRAGINTFVFPSIVAETPKISIKDHEIPFPMIPFGIVAYGFVGQPFSKQLYTNCLREFHNNGLCKIWEPDRVHYGQLENRELPLNCSHRLGISST